MWHIKKSRLFATQWRNFALDYKARAGIRIADQFIDAVEDALTFISENPLACPTYSTGEEFGSLTEYEFRRWFLKKFPHSIYFRIMNKDTIFIEAMYAHKMDVTSRLSIVSG